jgi:hypothetical protein
MTDDTYDTLAQATLALRVSPPTARRILSDAGLLSPPHRKVPILEAGLEYWWGRGKGKGDATAPDGGDVDAAYKAAKLDKLTGRLMVEARDAARAGLMSACGRIKAALRRACDQSVDVVRGHGDRLEAARIMHAAICEAMDLAASTINEEEQQR